MFHVRVHPNTLSSLPTETLQHEPRRSIHEGTVTLQTWRRHGRAEIENSEVLGEYEWDRCGERQDETSRASITFPSRRMFSALSFLVKWAFPRVLKPQGMFLTFHANQPL